MANLRAEQKKLTRTLLLTSALELFSSQGYAATTVDHIATAAGTTRATFYAYFASRAELMRALIDEQLNEVLERRRSGAHGSTATDLVAVVAQGTPEAIDGWIRATAARWPEVRPLIRMGRDAAVVDPDLAGLIDRWMEEAISDIADGLAAADRFAPQLRHFRGTLAMAELDYVATHWGQVEWGIDEEQMLAELVASWVRLLT